MCLHYIPSLPFLCSSLSYCSYFGLFINVLDKSYTRDFRITCKEFFGHILKYYLAMLLAPSFAFWGQVKYYNMEEKKNCVVQIPIFNL